jgi:hypothetical protein
MNTTRKFIIFGPFDTLKRMGPELIAELKPKYQYEYHSTEIETDIYVVVFEEYQRQINSSTSLTGIIEASNKMLKVQMMATGGRMGFRGSSWGAERPLIDMLTESVKDFSKRYGLTIQELKDEPTDDKVDINFDDDEDEE